MQKDSHAPLSKILSSRPARADAGHAPPDAIPTGPTPPDIIPAPRNAGLIMDGYRDYFSQGGSSSTDSVVVIDDFSSFSQALLYLQSSPNRSSPRVDMENLDLNSHVEFLFLDAYLGYIQSDGGHNDDGTPPLGRDGRSRLSEFLPPHLSEAGSKGGHGSKGRGVSNSLNIGLGSDGLSLGMGGGGRSLAVMMGSQKIMIMTPR
jgi:hypothetical protein